jgi:hypothetical protein
MNGPTEKDLQIQKLELLITELTYDELIQLNEMIVSRIKQMRKAGTLISMSRFRLGEHVKWNHQGQAGSGIIVRFNHKTVSVQGDDGIAWKIPPGLLHKAN